MTSTITADNGTTSGSAGLKSAADSSGILALQTGAGTAALTLNASQALGVGSTPSYGTSGQVLTSAGTSASPTWSTPVGASSATTWTATQTFSGSSSTFGAILTNTAETATVSATAATGTINFYINSQSVLYYTSNASANFTLNFAFSSGTSLNTALATGQTVTCVFLNTNGATAYYASAFQVDGSSVTPKWQGGTAPTAGNASSIDVYQFSITKTASATYTVLASLTQFK
jgi:hypothetical protein